MTDGDVAAARRRVVLICGLESGRMAARFLRDDPAITLAGVFVIDDAGGADVSGFRTFDDLIDASILCKISRVTNHDRDIANLAPDLIVVVGISQIIPASILSIPTIGTIGFHNAVLPDRRGCSPIIWAIADGLSETGVSMFYMDQGIDTGDIIAVNRFPIGESEDAAVILGRANEATLSLLRDNLHKVLDGTAPRMQQKDSAGLYTRKRGPSDGEIDWSKPAKDIFNLVRALAPPYPMAHTFGSDGVPILVERVHIAGNRSLPALKSGRTPATVLCIGAHPDDEVLGVGGTLALHANQGDRVVVLILSGGEDEKNEAPKCASRRECATNAAKAIGTDEVLFYDFPDQRLDSVPFIEIIHSIEDAIRRFNPSVVYTHHSGDANTDHHVAFKATYAACRPMSSCGQRIRKLLAYETPSSTDQAPQVSGYFFTPNYFVDIEPVWDRKLRALQCYPSEMIGGKHPRSYAYIEALARMRAGYSGFSLAEAFVLLRERRSPGAI
jgi:methionyl-tRNA formyltransferase/LmbE family N-acetylglucosaminyl deacetylase